MEVHTRGSQPHESRITTSKKFDLEHADSNKENVGPQLQLRGGGTPGSASKKRRHQERDSALQDDYHVADEATENPSNSTPKRPRTAEWPLKDGVDINIGVIQPSMANAQSNQKQRSPGLSKRRSRIGRKSVFKEGSLNDKPSRRPPIEIVGEGSEGFTTVDSGQAVKQMENARMHESKDTAKTGGMFRFGKAIASALNPVSFWQGMWKEKEQSYTDLKPEAQEQARKEEIDKAYNKLRDSGYKGVKQVAPRPSVEPVQQPSAEESAQKRNSFRDSGIDMGESSARPSEEAHKPAIKGLQIPKQAQRASSTSPAPAPSSVASSRRSFSQLRSASSSNLRKVRSHINIPSPRKRNASIKNIPSIDSVLANDAAKHNMNGLSKKVSKKDLAKANRLDKKVSDLETRLEAARAERTALSTIPSPDFSAVTRGRKPFVPGALDSLPSERLLNVGAVRTEHDDIVETVPKQESAKNVDKSLPPTPDQKVGSWLDLTPRKRDAGNTPLKPGRATSGGKKTRSQTHVAEQPLAVPEPLRRSKRRRSGRLNEESSGEPVSEKMDSAEIRRSGKGWVEYYDAEPVAKLASPAFTSTRNGKRLSAPTPRNSPTNLKLQENQRLTKSTVSPASAYDPQKSPPLGIFLPPGSQEIRAAKIHRKTVPPPRKPVPVSNLDTITDPNISLSSTKSTSITSRNSSGPHSDKPKQTIIDHNSRVRKPTPKDRKARTSGRLRATPSPPAKSEFSLPSSDDSEYVNSMLQGRRAHQLRTARREKATDNFGNACDEVEDGDGTKSLTASTIATTMQSSTTAAEGEGGPGPATKAVRRINRKSTSRDLRKRKSAGADQDLIKDVSTHGTNKARKCEHERMDIYKDLPRSPQSMTDGHGADEDVEMGEVQDIGRREDKEPYVWEDEDVF